MNSDEGQDGHNHDYEADKIDDPVHGVAPLNETKRNAKQVITERFTRARVPFPAGKLNRRHHSGWRPCNNPVEAPARCPAMARVEPVWS
jgi:hypothetical protein